MRPGLLFARALIGESDGSVARVRERVAVVGPGAVGATVAAYLHRAGHPLVLCGRTPRDRLDVRPDGADPIVVPGPVLTDPGDVAGPVPLVMLAVKATQLNEAAARWLRVLCDEHTTVCVLQNGVEQVELVQPLCPRSTVVPAIVWLGAETQPDGWVRLRGEPRLTVPASASVAHALRENGFVVTAASDFATEAWRKLLVNALAGFMVLAGRRSGMFRRDDVAALARRYLAECLTVARAEGAHLGAEVIDEMASMFGQAPEDVGTSMLFDREARRPLEWDIRNGVILRRARQHGLAAPISEVIVPLLAAASDGPG